jgi:uncharacterized RDD family membrane protein YckC
VAESPPSEPRPLRLRLGEVTFPLNNEKLVIGRSRSCDIRLREDTVSRLHAALVWREGALVLEDLGSSNGTFVNGERVLDPHSLAAGDDVRFGALRGIIEKTAAAPLGSLSSRAGEGYGADFLPGRPAGFGWRVLAAAADVVLFLLGSLVAFAPLLALLFAEGTMLSPEVMPPSLQTKALVAGGCAALWVLFTFFYVVHGWARRGGTPGLRLCGLRLLDWRHTTPIGYPRAFLRLGALVVTFLTLGLGFLVVPFRRDRKALHDLLAGTLVTHRGAPLGGVSSPA